MKRQSGFTFIEILVVMGILVALMGMVVAIVPYVQERGKRTEAVRKVQQMVTFMADRYTSKHHFPPYDGKAFVLSLVATGQVDRRNPDNLGIFFSPGDELYQLGKVAPERWKEISLQSLKTGEFSEMSSWAGRRNTDREFLVTSDRVRMGVPIICDDDDGPLHHSEGLIIGYTSGSAKFVEWADMEMMEPEDPNEPERFLGDAADIELLRALSGD